ncbi:hypothetical protein DPMN_140778 [Dreissena polymorpha]|uniref:Uncharacterized protein n=1 Tax=Dreissena polymorpha TaxID=45954 RepID=A0A9D4G8C5_DREPO|nr:hypothetical protein DPMN_140778 [Dreissena polymorpha]
MATSQLLTQTMMSNSVNMSNLNMVQVSSEGVNIPGMPVLFNVLQALPISIAISQPSESLPVISGVTSMAAQFVDPPDLPDTRPQASVIQMHTNSYEQVYGTSNTGVLQSMAIKRTYAEEFGGN